MWGVGGLTWGLMIRYLGVGLGLAVGCGLCASAGTLIPPLFKGEFGGLLQVASGQATLVGVVVALGGIVMVGMAGMSKEKELPEEEKKKAVAEFNFQKGMLVAIFSGVMSAGMAFGLGSGAAVETSAVSAGTSPTWKGIPVLVVVLLGGFTVNFIWCLYLNFKNKTTGDYSRKDAPLAANLVFAGSAGLIWCLQFITFKVADSKIGDFAFAGWTVFMSSMIIFSTLLGIALGRMERRQQPNQITPGGKPRRARGLAPHHRLRQQAQVLRIQPSLRASRRPNHLNRPPDAHVSRITFHVSRFTHHASRFRHPRLLCYQLSQLSTINSLCLASISPLISAPKVAA